MGARNYAGVCIFINTRGNSKLYIYQNHTFRFMYKKAYGSQLWYCWSFYTGCCPAKLRINDAGKVTECIGSHNHDPPTCWMTPDGKSYSLSNSKQDSPSRVKSLPSSSVKDFIKENL